ncbi:hypothetical protein Ahy_B10g103818 [Arachis hypogaea]|uniref:Uncharacterized protein n=1 Tax=Arachis hypogaea TaxID=3818 RepID=A0A444X476_ARAHY|nr:hypothetical protein Ahy_B10g103818 [Arachis hypogaea]
MRLRSGKIIHMADEVSNLNGGLSINDSILGSMQQANVSSHSEAAIGTESITVTTVQTGNAGHNIRPRDPFLPYQPPLTAGWPPYSLPPGYTPPVGGFIPPSRFGNTSRVSNTRNPQQHSDYSRDYNVGSTSNATNLMAVYRHQVEKSHHDLVNLLTQQMTTILNPMMADHESKFERLARQVERIARIVDYDEGSSDRTHEKEKEKYRNEQRSKSKPFTRKEKVAYVTMESSEEELDFETEVDLDKLKKGPPYVFSGLGIVKNSKDVIICIDVIHNGGIEHLPEINTPTIEVEPGVIQEEGVEGEVLIRARNLS